MTRTRVLFNGYLRIANVVLCVENFVLSIGNFVFSIGNFVLSIGNFILSIRNFVLSIGNFVLRFGDFVLSIALMYPGMKKFEMRVPGKNYVMHVITNYCNSSYQYCCNPIQYIHVSFQNTIIYHIHYTLVYY